MTKGRSPIARASPLTASAPAGGRLHACRSLVGLHLCQGRVQDRVLRLFDGGEREVDRGHGIVGGEAASTFDLMA